MNPLVPADRRNGAPITRLRAGTFAQPAPSPKKPARMPIPTKIASPAGVRWTCHAMSRFEALHRKRRRGCAVPTPAGRLNRLAGISDFFASHISATMPNIVTPSAVCTTAAGKCETDSAPAIELADASKASGSARRRSASPARSRPGAGRDRARERDEQPGAAHEIEVKGQKAADDRHEQHSAADARRHSDHAKNEADESSESGQIHQADRSTRHRPRPMRSPMQSRPYDGSACNHRSSPGDFCYSIISDTADSSRRGNRIVTAATVMRTRGTLSSLCRA